MLVDNRPQEVYHEIIDKPIYIRGEGFIMETTKKAMNQEIDKQIEEVTTKLSTIYPGQDVELMMIQRLMKKRGAEMWHSEVDTFKQHAISTLGTDHEIEFNDAERGFLEAALTDGRTGFKEFIENIPVNTPVCEDGTKMTNSGIQKKTS